MHSCRDVSERATAMLDKELGLLERFQLRLHLRICPACRRYVRQMALVTRALRRLPAAAPAPQDERRLLEALQRASQETR
jgi:predicted anti-sigma-YlaC factor YlaD